MVVNKSKQIRNRNIFGLLLVILIIVAINILSAFVFTRLDLTSDKRYSIAEPSKNLVSSIDDYLTVKVYLTGENLPAGLRKLKESTRFLLEEFRAYGGTNVQYEFIDPNEISNTRESRDFQKQLNSLGLSPVTLSIREDDQATDMVIYPGAIVYYKNRNTPVQLLEQQLGRTDQEVIEQSILNLEYKFSNAIRKLDVDSMAKSIAFIQGHGELNSNQTESFKKELEQYYKVRSIDLPKFKVGALDNFDLAIIAKPTKTFTELEKYKIDQYLMKGGKLIYLIDPLIASMDSLEQMGGTSLTADYPLNIDDQLFKYGVRINRNLVQDMQNHMIGVIQNGRPSFAPWPYFPLVVPDIEHPISSNLSDIWFRFVSSIDTVAASGIKKTPLLKSSEYSRLLYHPVRITLQQSREKMDERLYNKGPQTLAVLLEGEFESLYKNRISPDTKSSGKYGKPVEKSPFTQCIVISDGDLIRNEYNPMRDAFLPLGYDPKSRQTFANMDFLLNCVDYLLDDSGILTLRSKDYQIRLLNKAKASSEDSKWKIINMALPSIIILLFGFVFNFIRARKYST